MFNTLYRFFSCTVSTGHLLNHHLASVHSIRLFLLVYMIVISVICKMAMFVFSLHEYRSYPPSLPWIRTLQVSFIPLVIPIERATSDSTYTYIATLMPNDTLNSFCGAPSILQARSLLFSALVNKVVSFLLCRVSVNKWHPIYFVFLFEHNGTIST